MHRHQQPVLVLAQPYQATTDKWPSREVKTAAGFFSDQLVQRCLAICLFTQVVLDEVKATVGGCSNALPRLTLNGHKRGAQCLVTSNNAVQRVAQRCGIKMS